MRYLVRLLLVLLAVSLLSFVLISASPIDPVKAYVGEMGMANLSPEALAQLEEYFGVNTPFLQRYTSWLGGVVRGDMGMSLLYRQPVGQVIGVKIASSIVLMMAAWLLSGIFGFVLGVVAGAFQDSLADKVIKRYSLIMASTPTFWFAMLLLMVFSVWLKILPIGLSAPIGVDASDVTVLDKLRHLLLPALTLSIIGVASITLHTREKMVEVMQQDYVLYAKSRGDSTLSIVKNHGLRNVVLPAITVQFMSFSEIIGGSVLVEQVFSYPGLGQAAVSSGLHGDAPLLLGIAIVSAIMVFCGNMIANILYGVIDPRVRRGANG